MLIRAQLEARPETGNRRYAVRRALRLGSVLPGSGAEVTIRDLSVTGLLIETSSDLAPGETLEVEIPGHGTETATVVWQSENFVGCSFNSSLPASAVSAALLRSPGPSAVASDVQPAETNALVLLSTQHITQGPSFLRTMDLASAEAPSSKSFRSTLGHLRRTAKFLFVQRARRFSLPTQPGLDEATLDRLKAELATANLYMEFGGGGTTLLAAEMAVATITVESDRFFAEKLKSALGDTSVRVLIPNIGLTERWGRPLFKKPTAARLKRWRRYVDAPFVNLRGFPDLILVDGRFRVACTLEAARQAYLRGRVATLILDDYEQRPRYWMLEQWLGKPARIGRSAVFQVGTKPVPELRWV